MQTDKELEAALKELDRLRAGKRVLRSVLAAQGIASPLLPQTNPGLFELVSSPPPLSSLEKIRLFRSLFRGREDVCAVRGQSPDGTGGWKSFWRDRNQIALRNIGRVTTAHRSSREIASMLPWAMSQSN